jgi:spore maturation protein SpmA
MLNWIFLLLIVIAAVTGALSGSMGAVSKGSIDAAKSAVELAIGLIGQMALWLGVMQVLQDAGLMPAIARALRPVMRWLFPDVPAEHPAMGAMIMNLAANMLGLGNAATPFGIKAMIELNKLNPRPGVATNPMALFLAINTSGVAVLPLGVIAVRATMKAENVTGIFLPSILATACSTLVAIVAAKALERVGLFSMARVAAPAEEAQAGLPPDAAALEAAEAAAATHQPTSLWRLGLALAAWAALAVGLGLTVQAAPPEQGALDTLKLISQDWILPVLLVSILLVGFSKQVKVYESVVKGAKQGFSVGVMIIPFLVAILVAIGMFRASGAMDYMVRGLGPLTAAVGLPAEALPMAFIRPLSGSGALAVLMETMTTYGPDSYVGFLVSVMSGSTETTFYTLAVYFGAVGVRAARHTVLACLAADVAGILAATVWARVFF